MCSQPLFFSYFWDMEAALRILRIAKHHPRKCLNLFKILGNIFVGSFGRKDVWKPVAPSLPPIICHHLLNEVRVNNTFSNITQSYTPAKQFTTLPQHYTEFRYSRCATTAGTTSSVAPSKPPYTPVATSHPIENSCDAIVALPSCQAPSPSAARGATTNTRVVIVASTYGN